MEKRNRSKNFTEREKHILLEIIKDYVHIIEDKRIDAKTNKAKLIAWGRVADTYNSQQDSGIRSIDQLRSVYDVLKRKARNDLNTGKIQMNGIDEDGSCSEDTSKTVISLLSQPARSYSNMYDTNSYFHGCVPDEPLQSDLTITSQEIKKESELDGTSDSDGKSISYHSEPGTSKEQITALNYHNDLSIHAPNISNESQFTAKRRSLQENEEINALRKRLRHSDTSEFTLSIHKIQLESAELDLKMKKQDLEMKQRRASAEEAEAQIRQNMLTIELEVAKVNLAIKKLEYENLKQSNWKHS